MINRLAFRGHRPSGHMRGKGFTLAELLISLAILGVIATFTIPKVLQSQANEQKKSVFRESIAAVQEIFYRGYLLGIIRPGTNLNGEYILDNINAVKLCKTDAQAENCWTQTLSTAPEAGEPGVILHNGATIIGLNNSTDPPPMGFNEFTIDWNGPADPNIEGDDQLYLAMCYEVSPCWGTVKPGTVGPHHLSASSKSLYEDIFE